MRRDETSRLEKMRVEEKIRDEDRRDKMILDEKLRNESK